MKLRLLRSFAGTLFLAFALFATSRGICASLLDTTTFQAETFAAYTAAEPNGLDEVLHTPIDHGKFGTGLAANVFFGEHVGLKLDSVFTAVDDFKGAAIDYSSASFVLRFPTSIHLDPYGLVGIGRNWEFDNWNTHIGLGAQARITQHAYAGAEARYIWDPHADALQLRAFLGYSF